MKDENLINETNVDSAEQVDETTGSAEQADETSSSAEQADETVGSVEQADETASSADPLELRQKKRRRNSIIGTAVIAVVVVAVVVLQLLGNDAAKRQQGAAINEQVVSGAVEPSNISKVLNAFGTLASANEEDVSVPGDIRVTKYHVSTGDAVKKGDIIATVNRNAVLAAIADVQDLIDEVDAKVEELKDESASSSLTASAEGTVVKVYATAGDAVSDVMYDHGALMLVSLDGLYAVKVDNTGKLRVGESVSVVGADGTQADGQIAAIEKETATVTVPLSGFSFDEKVTVNASSGTTLGSGKLFVYSQQKITGYSGTVASVSVGEGTAVSSGDTLLTLSDTDYTADTSVLLKQRKKLVDQSNRLTQISKTGYVYADEDGVITNLNSDLLDTSASNVVVATKGAAANNDKTTDGDAGSSDGDKTSQGEEKKSQVTAQDNDKAKDETEKKSEKENEKEREADHSSETITITAKVVWRASDGSDLTEGLPNSVTVSVSPGSKKQTASAGNDWSVSFDDLPKYNDDGSKEISYEVSVSGVPSGFDSSFSSSGNKATIYLTKAASGSDEEGSSSAASDSSDTAESGSSSSSSASSASSEDASTTSESGSSSAKSGSAASSSSAAGSKGSGSKGAAGKTPGGGVSAGSMSSSGALTEEGATIADAKAEQENPYAYEETVLCALMPNDEVSVDISIDELDIGSIVVGAGAKVTFDALPGQSFEGKISALNPFGQNSGGNTKYTVTVAMGKQESMLLGMSASVGIDLEDRANVLVVPEAALVEQDGKTYVYTGYDEAKDELRDLTEVETGIADGTAVEVTSGLAEGQTYYYRYADTVSYAFTNA